MKCKCIKDFGRFKKDVIYSYIVRNDGFIDIISSNVEFGFDEETFNEIFIDVYIHRKKVVEKLLNI
jgi:hypothetical protein